MLYHNGEIKMITSRLFYVIQSLRRRHTAQFSASVWYINVVWIRASGQCHPGHYHDPTSTVTAVVQAGDGVYSARRWAGAPVGCCRCPAVSSMPWTVSSDRRPRLSASSASLVSALASRNYAMTSRLIQVCFSFLFTLRDVFLYLLSSSSSSSSGYTVLGLTTVFFSLNAFLVLSSLFFTGHILAFSLNVLWKSRNDLIVDAVEFSSLSIFSVHAVAVVILSICRSVGHAGDPHPNCSVHHTIEWCF